MKQAPKAAGTLTGTHPPTACIGRSLQLVIKTPPQLYDTKLLPAGPVPVHCLCCTCQPVMMPSARSRPPQPAMVPRIRGAVTTPGNSCTARSTCRVHHNTGQAAATQGCCRALLAQDVLQDVLLAQVSFTMLPQSLVQL